METHPTLSPIFTGARARLELWLLKPIWLATLLCAVGMFVRMNWFGGVFLVVMMFPIGTVGQALHPEKSFSELAYHDHATQGELNPSDTGVPLGDSKLTHDESFILAKAVFGAGSLLTIEAGVMAYHLGLKWYFVVALALAVWAVVLPVGFAAMTRANRAE
jgi:hypothetical protein